MMCLAFVLSACAADRTLDAAQLEAEIQDQLLTEYPAEIRSVSCPSTDDPQPGQSVLCVATMGGLVLDVNVELAGTQEALTATASVDARFVAIDEVSALLAATFGDEVGLVTVVDCGHRVLVLPPEESVLCRATDPSGITRDFDVRVTDAGLVSLELR